MKKKRLLIIPILSILTLSFGAILTCSTNYEKEYIQLRAGESEVNNFNALYTEVRTNQPEVCQTSKEDCDKLVSSYELLTKTEQKVVNQEPDVIDDKYTKGQVMKEIIQLYYSNKNKNESVKKQKLNQSSIIVIAVVVSLIGMTMISVLYILKNNKYIE